MFYKRHVPTKPDKNKRRQERGNRSSNIRNIPCLQLKLTFAAATAGQTLCYYNTWNLSSGGVRNANLFMVARWFAACGVER